MSNHNNTAYYRRYPKQERHQGYRLYFASSVNRSRSHRITTTITTTALLLILSLFGSSTAFLVRNNVKIQHKTNLYPSISFAPKTISMTSNSKTDEVATKGISSIHSSSSNWKIIQKNHNDEDLLRLLNDRNEDWNPKQYEACLSLYDDFLSCTDAYVEPGIKDALNCLDHAYRLYGPKSVICSFNGGKDAVVILQLVRAAHAHYFRQQQLENGKNIQKIIRPRVLYFYHQDEFPDLMSFVYDTIHEYDLDMIAFQEGIGFSGGLQLLVDNNFVNHNSNAANVDDKQKEQQKPFPMAFVLGTRSSDPNAGTQGQFAPSSHYMPPFMRVNPILDWSYGLVWHFLRLFQLPYCSLYDEGYTSLGTTKDTLPCPALLVPGGSAKEATISTTTNPNNTTTTSNNAHNGYGLPKYWPAYMLRDWDQERAGRIKKKKKGSEKEKKKDEQKQQQQNKKSAAANQEKQSATATAAASATTATGTTTVPSGAESITTTSVSAASSEGFRRSDNRLMDNVNLENIVSPDASVRSTLDANQSCISYSSSLADGDDKAQEDGTKMKQIGLIIIGDEILKGFTADINTISAAKAIRKYSTMNHDIGLKRVIVISDNQNDIVEQIQLMQEDMDIDVIITSGGVGPTHDDVTIKSVAVALNRDMELHEEMALLLKSKMNNKNTTATTTANSDSNQDDVFQDLTEAQKKMATLPSNSKLKYLSDDENDWPVLQCYNIFVLPGIPEFFAKKIDNVARYLSSSSPPAEAAEKPSEQEEQEGPVRRRSSVFEVVLSIDESSIVSVLNQVVKKHPNVSFGSYPFVSHPEFKTVLTLEGERFNDKNEEEEEDVADDSTPTSSNIQYFSKEQMDKHVKLGLDDLITMLPKGSILRVVDNTEGNATSFS